MPHWAVVVVIVLAGIAFMVLAAEIVFRWNKKKLAEEAAERDWWKRSVN